MYENEDLSELARCLMLARARALYAYDVSEREYRFQTELKNRQLEIARKVTAGVMRLLGGPRAKKVN